MKSILTKPNWNTKITILVPSRQLSFVQLYDDGYVLKTPMHHDGI